jgi:putative PEP-CTERM system histidine kinase
VSLQFIWGLISLIAFLANLGCGIIFLIKTGVKKVSLYFFAVFLALGLASGFAGLIAWSFPGISGIKGLALRTADKLIPLIAVFIPFLLFQVSLYFGRVESGKSNPGLGIFIKTAGFITLIAFVLIAAGVVEFAVILGHTYAFIMQDFLSRTIGIILGILMAIAFVNFETTLRAASGVVKKQVFILMLLVLFFFAGLLRLIFMSAVSLVYIKISLPLLIIGAAWLYILLLRRDAGSSNVVVARQAFYSSALILFLGLFLVLVGLVGKLIMILGGKIDVFLSILGAFLVIGIFLLVMLSDSLRKKFDRAVQERVYAGRFDYKAEWRASSENFSACDNLELLYKTLENEIDRLLSPLAMEIFIADGKSMYAVYPPEKTTEEFSLKDEAAEWLFYNTEPVRPAEGVVPPATPLGNKISGFSVVIPLVAEKKLVGLIFLDRKKNGENYNTEEMALLSAMAHQAAVAILHLRARDRLLENEMIASFHKTASFVVHDLKNAVSMLSLMLQNAPRKMADPEFQTESLNTISQAVVRMQRIIEKLKSPPKKENLHIAGVNVPAILKKALEKSNILNKSDIRLNITLDDNLEIQTDPRVLETVLINLLINAVEAMPDSGTISINREKINDKIMITISDTGIGMSESFIKNKLFRPFQTTKAKGLGIGLYQCREMIRETGGDIIAESIKGKGSTFKLIVPA